MAPLKNISDGSNEARRHRFPRKPLRHCRKTNQVIKLKGNAKILWTCACSKHFFKISPPPCHMQNHDDKLVNEHSEQNLAEQVGLAALKIVRQNPKSDNPEGMSSVSTLSTASKPAAKSSVLGNAVNPPIFQSNAV